MKKLLFLGALLLSTVCMNAQTSEYYQEAANPIATKPRFMGESYSSTNQLGKQQTSASKKEEPAPIQ